MIFGREPARWIGLIVALVVAIIRVLAGDQLISPDQQATIENLVQKIADLALLAAPWIAGELIRPVVTPAADPVLASGTTVTVTPPPNPRLDQPSEPYEVRV